jgi:hypothetical protein
MKSAPAKETHETAAAQSIREGQEQRKAHDENIKNPPTHDASVAVDEAAARGEGLSDRPRTHGKPQMRDMVNYVLANGDLRPFIIVRVWNEAGNVSGHVFHDGPNDAKIDQHGPYKADVAYDPDKSPETWHWPS